MALLRAARPRHDARDAAAGLRPHGRGPKGLRYRTRASGCVIRNSLIPVITAAGPLLGYIITRLVRDRADLQHPRHRPVLRHRRQRTRLLGRDGADGAPRADHLSRTSSSTSSTASSTRADAGRADLMVVDPSRTSATRVMTRRAHDGGDAGRRSARRTSGSDALAPLHAATAARSIARPPSSSVVVLYCLIILFVSALRPECGRLLASANESPSLAAPVRHRQVRPRPLPCAPRSAAGSRS